MSVRIHTLSNGFRIVTESMPGLKSATVGIWVGAGGRHEGASENGIAHFLEHMAFKGTPTRSALRIAEEIEDVGGYINAYTSREMTAYYARCLSVDVPRALSVISDIVLNPLFSQEDIETERHVILQEIGQTNDTPDDIIFDWLHEVTYPGQAFGRTILGPEEKVASFTADDFRRFVARHYGPDRMILSAAGGVDHDSIVAEAEKVFGDLTPVGSFKAEGARFLVGERREEKDLEQAHFALNLEAPSYRDPAVYAAQVWSTAMGGGMSSRLFQKIREERGLCYSIHAQSSAYDDTGHVTIYAGTSAAEIGELAELTVAELKRAAGDMSDAEVARARAQLSAGMLMGLESPSSRAERNARMLSVWNRVPDLDETVRKVEAVTTADVRDTAAQMLKAPVALAVYGPVSLAPSLAALRSEMAA
ncbi:M16 family metallopeptidase [Pseudogemmobacter faecipullorum]|uniref:Insulinase family protein n=1 Tax=Pseudogemmobacter faecipullorum TaxID=2755041 RepID=A0ABS8CL80_9RHOB|nr:pitrilysin family protein [Pseudogemmobacter faecipullorum]MCB5410132.1 insulinase family protein [Pseudogemmobacter faecipullorum]